MEYAGRLGYQIEFEPETHGLPAGVKEYWFNVSDEDGLAFRVAMRVDRDFDRKRDASEVAQELGLLFTRGLIDAGYERGRVYREERPRGWQSDWNDATHTEEDLQVELLRALRHVKRAEARLGSFEGLEVAGLASVIGVRLRRLQDALSDLLTKGLASPQYPTFGHSEMDGAVTISSFGLAALEQFESSRVAKATLAVMFTDIAKSTASTARLGGDWPAVNQEHQAVTTEIVNRHGGRVWKALGDGFLITFSAATDAIAAGSELATAMDSLGLGLRVGIHAGEVEVHDSDVTGLVVSIAARVCAEAQEKQVLVTQLVLALTSEEARSVGTKTLSGVPGEWELFDATK